MTDPIARYSAVLDEQGRTDLALAQNDDLRTVLATIGDGHSEARGAALRMDQRLVFALRDVKKYHRYFIDLRDGKGGWAEETAKLRDEIKRLQGRGDAPEGQEDTLLYGGEVGYLRGELRMAMETIEQLRTERDKYKTLWDDRQKMETGIMCQCPGLDVPATHNPCRIMEHHR